jgi:hypothetical protein
MAKEKGEELTPPARLPRVDPGSEPQVPASERVLIKKLDLHKVTLRLEGVTPLVCHAWSEKMRQEMLARQQGGKRVRMREKRDPDTEFEAARYRLSDGTDGVPLTGVKAAVVTAANKDLGVPKNMVQRGLFIEADEGLLVRVEADPPRMREDIVRVGMGSADLRYRPEYAPWALNLRITYDADILNVETIFNLFERAGYGIGICEWRPEKGGEWGRFRVARGA